MQYRQPPQEVPATASSTAPWSAAEDALIVQLVESHGPKWTLIAQKLATGRSDSSVRNRFNRLTAPAQEEKVRDRASELPWTTADDEALRVGIARHGFKWRTIIRELLPERTCHAVRNRFQRHLNKAQQSHVTANDASQAAAAAAIIPPAGARHPTAPPQQPQPGSALGAAQMTLAAANATLNCAMGGQAHAQPMQMAPQMAPQQVLTNAAGQPLVGPNGTPIALVQPIPPMMQQQQMAQPLMHQQVQQMQQVMQERFLHQLPPGQQLQQMVPHVAATPVPLAAAAAAAAAAPPASALANSLDLIQKDLSGTDLAAVHAYAQRLREMRAAEAAAANPPTSSSDNGLPLLRLQPPSEMPPVEGHDAQHQPPPAAAGMPGAPMGMHVAGAPFATLPVTPTTNLPIAAAAPMPMHVPPNFPQLQPIPAGADDHTMMVAASAAVAQQQAQAREAQLQAQAQAGQVAIQQQQLQQAQQQHQAAQHAAQAAQAAATQAVQAAQAQQVAMAQRQQQLQAEQQAADAAKMDDLAAKSWSVVPASFLQMAQAGAAAATTLQTVPAVGDGQSAAQTTAAATGGEPGSSSAQAFTVGNAACASGVLKGQSLPNTELAAAVNGLQAGEIIDQRLVDLTDDLAMLTNGLTGSPQQGPQATAAQDPLGLDLSGDEGGEEDGKARSRSWLGGSSELVGSSFFGNKSRS